VGDVTGGPQTARFNPLSSRFQAEIETAVREIVSRYRNYSSFAGIQLQLDQDSQLIFMGDRWGYNESLLKDFQQATRGKLPPAEQVPRAMSGTLRLSYLNWRAQELTGFFARLGDLVGRAGPQCRLYLHISRLWDADPRASDFFQPDSILRNPPEYLLAHGLDVAGLRQNPHTIVWDGTHQLARSELNAGDWIRKVAQQRGLAAVEQQPVSAALVTYQPSTIRLPQFGKLAELAQARQVSDTLYALEALPQAEAAKELIGQLFIRDRGHLVAGAWLPKTSQASALRQLQATFLELPPESLRDFPTEPEGTNLRVRLGQHGSRTYLQFVNHAPWVEEIACVVQHSAAEPPVRILGGRDLPLHRTDDQAAASAGYHTWRLTIPAYDMVGLAVDDPGLELIEVAHAPRQRVLEEIADELHGLETIISQATDPTLQTRLADVHGEFEQWSSEGQPVGWNISTLPSVRISRSDTLPHSGQSCLMIDNENQGQVSAWIQSLPIPAPDTGRLALRAWIRAPSTGGSGAVRLSVSGHTQSGDKFERAMDLQVGTDSRSIANDWGTQPATLHVADIPENLDELSVAIELIGRGRIWVDDMEVSQAWLHPDEKIYLQGTLFVAKQKLAENNPYPAEQLLDSHWGHYLSEFQPTEVDTRYAGEKQSNATRRLEDLRKSQPWSSSPNLFQQLRQSVRERWRR
jgi:hypothetical protein